MILSICIPSYNRFSELKKLLDSIAQSESDEFNVFIVDNGSSDDINLIGSYDERFNFIKRCRTIPGPINIRTSLDYGDADYVMLCLDKDFIIGEYLTKFIEELKKNTLIACGYCKLNSNDKEGQIIISDVSIEKLIYRCGHPSGYFFKKEIIKEANEKINSLDKKSSLYNNPFSLDLIYPYGLLNGKEGIYTGIFIVTETLQKASETKSYTYSLENKNIYFMPDCRKKQMFLFLEHLEKLDFDKKIKKAILSSLFKRTLMDCTFGYRNIMKNKQICNHHSILCQKIKVSEMFKEAKILSKEFIKSKFFVSESLLKYRIIAISWFIFLIKILLKK